jgi:hypothetical protein
MTIRAHIPNRLAPGELKMPLLDDVSVELDDQANLRVLDGKAFGVGSPSLPACENPSQTHPYEAYPASLDMEQFEAEDKFGCARGIVWALIFEAALIVGAVLVWKFHFFSH